MDQQAVLAAFDEQIRREGRDAVVRSVSTEDGWHGVIWSDLDETTADAAISAQIDSFAELSQPWEWKVYSYDRPADLPDRLLAAGFTPEPVEALLVAEIAELRLDGPPPDGVELVTVADQQGADALVAVHDEVFGGDYSSLGRMLLASPPEVTVGVVAMAEATAVSAARVEFHAGTEFASLWGGGTLPAWRGRGIFRALVAHRAALAAAQGYRYLQVDASPDSRPILRRLGFVELATTTPFKHPGTARK